MLLFIFAVLVATLDVVDCRKLASIRRAVLSTHQYLRTAAVEDPDRKEPKRSAPEQGYEGEHVWHEDGHTMTEDWGMEGGGRFRADYKKVLKFSVHGLDHAGMEEDVGLFNAFEDAVTKAVADAVGYDAGELAIELDENSLGSECSVWAHKSGDAKRLRDRLANCLTLESSIEAAISRVDGIEKVSSSGHPSVSVVMVYRGEKKWELAAEPTTTTTRWTTTTTTTTTTTLERTTSKLEPAKSLGSRGVLVSSLPVTFLAACLATMCFGDMP